MQHFDYKPHGVCPMRISFDLEGDTVHNVSFTGGCNGNLQGISRLVVGMDAQEAIRRMTSQPAARMGLVGRGSLQKGNYADILVFDPKKFTDHATFTNPAQKATGLDWCIVNGQVAIDHDRRTTTGAGMVLTV